MKKITMLAAAVALTVSACATSGPTVTEADAKASIAAASAACKKAKAVNYEWRDACKGLKNKKTKKPGGLLAKAKAAMESGDFAEAKKLADKSARQSENAYAQYEANKNAGPRY